MKREFLSLVLSFVCTILFAQAPSITWQKSLGGTLADEAKSVQPTGDGGYVVGGTTSSNNGDVTGNHGGTDCWIVKLSSTGSIEWQKTLGGTGNETFGSIRVTPDGGYIIGATTSSNNGDVSGNHGSTDAWIVKLTSTGTISWQKCFGSTGLDELRYVEETLDGGYIAMGISGTNDGDLSSFAEDYVSGGWIFKLSSTRTIEWQKSYHGFQAGGTFFNSIRQTSDGGFVYCGYISGNTGYVFINKVNNAGTPAGGDGWGPQFFGMYSLVASKCVAPTDNGGCIAVFKDELTLNPMVKKYNSAMAVEWTKIFDASECGDAYSISKTTDGGYILAGTASNGCSFSGTRGGSDYWLAKITSTGTFEWQRSLGSAGNDFGYWGEQKADGSYIIAGKGVANSGDITGNHGGDDFWVVKLGVNNPVITSSAGANGTISPNGNTTVTTGGNQTYIITPNTNYHIADVLIDGVSNAVAVSSGTYTFTNVTVAHTIDATFALNNSYSITASAGANGTISPNGNTSVFSGNNQAYTITANANYHIADVLVDGVSNAGAISSGTYTFTNVTAPHTISAAFAINTYAITSSAGANGSISPNGTTQVAHNGSQAYSITPGVGYVIANVLVDGLSVGDVNSYTFNNVTATHTISASFAVAETAPDIRWQKSLGGTAADEATSIQQTSDGGYIVGGTSSSNNGDVSGNHGGTDYWVVKLGSAGSIAWQKSFGGSGSDIFKSIRQTSDGGYIVAGYTNSNDGDVSGNHAANNDGWVVKLSSTGNIEWQKCFGGTGIDFLYYIEQTSDGGYIAVGNSPGGDGNTAGTAVGGGGWALKINSTGVLQWQRSFGSGSPMGCISQTTDGGYIVGGRTTGISATYQVIKLNSSGATQWQNNLTAYQSDIYLPTSIKQTSDGGYIFSAFSYGSKLLIVKLNSSGISQWAKFLGGDLFETPGNVTQTSDGGYLVTGTAYSNVGDVSGNHEEGTGDYWLLKLNSFGTLQWQKPLGGLGTDDAHWGEATSDGGYIIAGKGISNTGDITGNHGDADFWVVKLGGAAISNVTITSSAGTNGTINPIGNTSVPIGGSQSYTITPNANYHINDVLIDGVTDPGAIVSGTYTFNNVAVAHTISASFALNTFAITASAGANGSISPNGITQVGYNSSQSYTITANSGYNIADVLVDGASVGVVSSYTFNNVTTAHVISASFVSGCPVNNWTGAINNDWNNPGNWSCNIVPLSGTPVIISAGTPHLNENFTVGGSLTISGTGSLVVDAPYTLAISGSADFGGKPVTFSSTASGTASLGLVSGTLINATNVTVERYLPNNGFRSWRLLSVPTYGSGQTIRQSWQEGDANPLPKQNNLANRGTQITGVFATQAAAAAAGFDSTSVQAGMLSWNGTGWSNVTSTNQPLANQKSWFVYVRGDRSQTVTGSVNSSTATTLRSKGTIYTGDQVTNIAANAFALVPNVYPSAINFTGLTRNGGVNNLFYIWDSKKLNGNSLGAYQTFSATNGFACMVGGGSYVLGQPNTTIESGQSFFVTSSAAGSITLKESAKISGTNGNLGFRPTVKSKIDTRLYNHEGEMLDANAVVFDAAYSTAVSGEDAPKFGNPGANFAIETENKLLAIEGTRLVKEGDAVQFRMWNLAKGAYTLEIEMSNMALPEGVTAMLEDSYLQTSTSISASGATKVKFEVSGNAGSSAANRFRIVFAKEKPVISSGKAAFTVSPNPIEGGVMNVSFTNQAAGKYSIRLVTNGGQSLMAKAVMHAGGNAVQNISLPSGIASGTYTVEIVAPNKTRSVQTVFVNRK